MKPKLCASCLAVQALGMMEDSPLFASRFPKPLTRWQRLVRWIKGENPAPSFIKVKAEPGEMIKIKLPPRYVTKISAGEKR